MDAAELGGHASFSLAGTRDREPRLFFFLPVCLCSSKPVCKTLDMKNTGVRVHSRLSGEGRFVPGHLQLSHLVDLST